MKNSQEDTPNHQNAVSHQFHQHAASLPGRLTPCVVRLVGCHENPALQEARCAVPRNIHTLPGSGRSATASHETTARGLPCRWHGIKRYSNLTIARRAKNEQKVPPVVQKCSITLLCTFLVHTDGTNKKYGIPY